jgi:serine-type D-Ala-D-Ala carboxypeptidase/endopeptidase (penicillin-binding protein 4)
MRKYLLLIACCSCTVMHGQIIKEKLDAAMRLLEGDSVLTHAIVGLTVVNTKTGALVYEHNGQVGLAPASTQKLFTSAAAFELLGHDFTYNTELVYKHFRPIPSRSYFVLTPGGDPSFGSSRFAATRPAIILKNIIAAVKANNVSTVSPQYVVNDSAWGRNAIPGGWIWEDIGNYYGAAANSLNWMENQYDIVLKSGPATGKKAELVKTIPAGIAGDLSLNVTTAANGTGDNSLVYPEYGRMPALMEGTIPAGEDSFIVGASIADPRDIFLQHLNNTMKAEGINMFYGLDNHAPLLTLPDSLFDFIPMYKHASPTFDSLNYWFLKKSINLYGEAFIKTMALQKEGEGTTEKGVGVLTSFWTDQGIDKAALHIYDGSGLSPQNRVTTHAMVQVLQFAKTKPWYASFYYSLPEYNGMKMKSGSINGARAYAGYHTAKDGSQYSFSIIVNNYDGAGPAVVKKIFKLLDSLK